jgi:hypothetical protein
MDFEEPGHLILFFSLKSIVVQIGLYYPLSCVDKEQPWAQRKIIRVPDQALSGNCQTAS